MNFLYPSFLFGLFAVAVPVIVHLFNLRRHKKIIFTNVRFLKAVKETQTSHRKLYRLLILACRILFIIFLTSAFAQPFLGGEAGNVTLTKEVRIYIDNSPSMSDRLNDVVKTAENLVRSFPASARFRYFSNDMPEGTDVLTREAMLIKLRNTETSFAFRTVRELKDLQDEMAAGPRVGSLTYWFSDFQKTAFSEVASVKVRESDRLYLLPTAQKTVKNVFIDSLWTDTPLPGRNVNHMLYVRIRNSGGESAEVSVNPVIDEVQIGAKPVQLQPEAVVEATFPFRLSDSGYHRGKVSVNDEVSFDNDYFFVLKAIAEVDVQVAAPRKSYALQVFKTDPFFKTNSIPDVTVAGGAFPNLLVADGIAAFTPQSVTALKQFVAVEGGSLLLIPAANLDVNSYNRLAAALGLPSLRSVQRSPGSETSADELLMPDPRDSFFAGVFARKIGKDVRMPFAIPVLDFGGNGSGRTILQRKDKSAFLSYFQCGKGKVYVCSTPLAEGYTNFFEHPLIVPVLYKAAFRSVQSEEKTAYFLNRVPVKVAVEGAEKDRAFTLVKDSLSVIPRQSFNNSVLTFDIPRSNLDPGWYNLVYNKQKTAIVAFNTDRRESYPAAFSAEELRELFKNRKNISVEEVNRSESLAIRSQGASMPVKLWKYCLILALVFLLLETLLVRRLKMLSAA